MEARTRSSNARAWAALLAGLVAAVALPAAIAASEALQEFRLLKAWVAIPVAAGAGIAAILLARGAEGRIQRTLGRARGRRVARLGRALGLLGLYLATTGVLTLVVYAVLRSR